ncbi:MAG: bifunctional (p)ppGpp synthetase/guanosine-3',5'-bis(diphosphate) 3'-pyrophosphohydrolase [Verrucomicrobia bacterium]|nr:bifunctional (p)ppGpp synthetase/guanosine-3',5'-bis(diphosphate) 3'-pyrophosphohydrolase [Verrucomicrobiota bacterium]
MFVANETVKNFDEKYRQVEPVNDFSHKQEFAKYAHNNPCVLDAYARFENALRNSDLKESEITTILDAVVFAAEKHQFQTRKNAEHVPYIIHPIGVAYNILTIAKCSDPKVLTAAVLHDTVEDTNTSYLEIRERFGIEVEGYVQELTDDTELPKHVRKDLQVINAAHKTKGAAYIKLADKLYNLTDLSTGLPKDWTQERADEYFRWAKKVVDQLPPVSPELKAAIEQISALYWSKKTSP